jgi:hypothetical protein
MNPYIDAGFLLTLITPTKGTRTAREIVQSLQQICSVNLLHELQVQSFLSQAAGSGDRERANFARSSQKLWHWYKEEGFFRFDDLDWSTALHASISWIAKNSQPAPAPLLILHPILALIAGASHFLSFDPRSRKVAKEIGLKVLPERL